MQICIKLYDQITMRKFHQCTLKTGQSIQKCPKQNLRKTVVHKSYLVLCPKCFFTYCI